MTHHGNNLRTIKLTCDWSVFKDEDLMSLTQDGCIEDIDWLKCKNGVFIIYIGNDRNGDQVSKSWLTRKGGERRVILLLSLCLLQRCRYIKI